MKGVELPVNVLVIISIAVLVMLGLIALYLASTPGGASINIRTATSVACSQLINQGGCDKDKFTTLEDFSDILVGVDVGGDGDISNDNLEILCIEHYGINDAVGCKKLCICPGY